MRSKSVHLVREISSPIREILAILKRPYHRYLAIKKFDHCYKKHGLVKLEIGAGDYHGSGGWLTLDVTKKCDIFWDLRWQMPFPDNSVNYIYCSHVLEHFNYRDMVTLIKEILRVLEPGGQFSACVPDASIYINGYREDPFDSEYFLQYKPAVINLSRLDVINYIAYMDGHHRHMFDQDELIELFIKSGFANVKQREFDPTIDMESRKYESIYALGYKPDQFNYVSQI